LNVAEVQPRVALQIEGARVGANEAARFRKYSIKDRIEFTDMVDVLNGQKKRSLQPSW
jgi:hypothetical protein